MTTRFTLLVTSVLLSTAGHAAPTQHCDPGREQAAVEALRSWVDREKLYASWAQPQCLRYTVESCAATHIDIAIREHHSGACKGDPATAPVVDRFRVWQSPPHIEWYDVTADEIRPVEAVCSRRACATTKPRTSKP